MRPLFKNKISRYWFILVTALAVHVMDETLNGFLPFYNELVMSIRDEAGFFPMPTFSFPVWLGGLILLILVCYSLTPLVGKARGLLKVPIAFFAVIMILNGCGHIGGSIYFERLLPGFWSSILLIPAAIFLLVSLYSKRR